ncbi:MAG: DUF6206 family protein [Thermoleophilia bacterium]
MNDFTVDASFLRDFESGLDPRCPESGPIPARILGHGEITTVLEIAPPVFDADTAEEDRRSGVACKRMPMFRGAAETAAYDALYGEYERILREEIGLDVVESRLVWLRPDPAPAGGGTTVLYIVQDLLEASAVGHVRLRRASAEEARALLRAALREMDKVFTFNERHAGRLEVGFDGQISNWAVVDGAPASSGAADDLRLRYFDTSTPLLRHDGLEQLEPELFLRAAPSFLVWIIRRFMLTDVLERYYDRRKVAVDLAANLYKEQRSDLVGVAVELVNEFLGPTCSEPVTEEEVRAYYREDARIWRVYLAFRKVDRLLHRLQRKEYPYILPGKVVR